MPAKLIIIWDYDSAIGQINSTLPYNFNIKPIYEEIKNVDEILSISRALNLKMTFACVGFMAETGVYPFNHSEQIKKMFDDGHEIASHSWRHEWFPYLTDKQIYKSLERSKYILEECLKSGAVVNGFVPPHSRPMSWYKKLSFSLGDRGIYPIHKGSDIGYIIKQLSKLKYKWCRVLKSFRPFWEKAFNNNSGEKYNFGSWETHHDIVCVPQHYTGFDEPAQIYLRKAIQQNETLVIVGHPAALSRNKSESSNNFKNFIEEVNKYKLNGELEVMTVIEFINKNIQTGVKSN